MCDIEGHTLHMVLEILSDINDVIIFNICIRYHAGEWSPCSTSCGPGTRTRSVRCKVYLKAFDSNFDISDLDCQGLPRPHDVEECQDAECTPPQGGSLFAPSRSTVAIQTDPTEPNVVHPDTDPTLELGPGPDVDIFIWRYSGYSPCSASCVGGESLKLTH